MAFSHYILSKQKVFVFFCFLKMLGDPKADEELHLNVVKASPNFKFSYSIQHLYYFENESDNGTQIKFYISNFIGNWLFFMNISNGETR